jgi:hypothetical protein
LIIWYPYNVRGDHKWRIVLNRNYFIESLVKLGFQKYDPKTNISKLLKQEYYCRGEFRVAFGQKNKKVRVKVCPDPQNMTISYSWSSALKMIKQILKGEDDDEA